MYHNFKLENLYPTTVARHERGRAGAKRSATPESFYQGASPDRQITDLIAAGVRRDDLYTDHGVTGAKARRPALDLALQALQEGDTLAITTLDRLGRSTANMLSIASNHWITRTD